MSEKKFDGNEDQSNEDEDFGLPKVPISPISKEESPSASEKKAVVPPLRSEKPKSTTPPTHKDESKKKSRGILWFLLLFLLLIGGGGLWYYLAENGTEPIQDPEIAVTEEPVDVPVTPEAEVPEEPVEEEISLTEITSKLNVPRYFVVVGSFIDQDLAMDHSQKLNNAGISTYLIHPYEDIPFYRLSVGNYDSFNRAVQEMNRIKSDYKEDLWVLKY